MVGCTSVPHVSLAAGDVAVEHPEFLAFDTDANIIAQDTVKATLSEAALTGKHAIIVMGANWCHDSRALAGWFQTSRFEALLQGNFVVNYVDVGEKDRNIDIAQSFGLDEIVGTPTIIVTNSEGEVLNLDTAPTWRNAASRDEDSIYDYFEALAPKSIE